MWNYRYLYRIDFRIVPVILALMIISLMIMASVDSYHAPEGGYHSFLTPLVRSQLRGFGIGAGAFLFFAGFDYNKLREWTWLLYAFMLFVLVGLFFIDPIQHVQRWYRIPVLNVAFQPSEYAKLSVVLALSWVLEKRSQSSRRLSTAILAGLVVGIPFLLILKQPDLGSALVLMPITLVMFYFGDLHPVIIRVISSGIVVMMTIVLLFFLGIVSHADLKPYATEVIKEYQYERLNPGSHHQQSSLNAIAIGGVTGVGWGKSEFTGRGWLPAAHTDSVFSAFGEEFGLLGLLVMIILFYCLIYFNVQITAVAKDHFGRLLAAGVSMYLAIHIIINMGMMCGFLPITGVPLILVTYGGSSALSTMAALGILQSVYSRRFMF
ncbi:MAG: FtsW/RodA/SpoVE family cell cycle protein [Chlamydiota bacterium]